MPEGCVLNSFFIPIIVLIHDEVDWYRENDSFVFDIFGFVDAFEFGMQQRLVALLFDVQVIERD